MRGGVQADRSPDLGGKELAPTPGSFPVKAGGSLLPSLSLSLLTNMGDNGPPGEVWGRPEAEGEAERLYRQPWGRAVGEYRGRVVWALRRVEAPRHLDLWKSLSPSACP